jgi:hypothetical protein
MPSESEKRLIAYALHRLQIGESHAAIEAHMATDAALPRLSPTEIRDAVTTASLYAQRASMLRRDMAPRATGTTAPTGPVGAYAGPTGVEKQYVGMTVYYEGTTQRGRRVQGSVVVNVWSESDIGAVRRGILEALQGGSLQPASMHYARGSDPTTMKRLEISVSTITPYSRRQGVRVATSRK